MQRDRTTLNCSFCPFAFFVFYTVKVSVSWNTCVFARVVECTGSISLRFRSISLRISCSKSTGSAFRDQLRQIPHFQNYIPEHPHFRFENADCPHFHFENADCPHFVFFANVSKNWRPYFPYFRVCVSAFSFRKCGLSAFSVLSVFSSAVPHFRFQIVRSRVLVSKSTGSTVRGQNRQVPQLGAKIDRFRLFNINFDRFCMFDHKCWPSSGHSPTHWRLFLKTQGNWARKLSPLSENNRWTSSGLSPTHFCLQSSCLPPSSPRWGWSCWGPLHLSCFTS